MSFASPLWLLVGALFVACGALALRAADRRRRRDLEQFATSEILADLTATLSARRRKTKRWLVLTATALGFVALAGPEAGFDWEETQRRGIDVLIAVDVSRSMLARDVQPDRLQRAKLAVDDLVGRLGGDRLGLIAFAGTAFLQCPLTLDHAAFQRSLDALEPGIISAPGSNLASALDVARKALESEAKNVKLLVLFSDGEDLRGGAVAAAERAADANIHVFTIGVGTPAGELIPAPGDASPGAFVKDASGHIVKSRLDEATLRRVAEITEGFYVPLGARAQGIDELVERALAPIPREELASRLRRVPRNRYQWPLAVALLLLAIEPFLGERRRVARVSAAAPLSLVALVLLLPHAALRANAASADSAARLFGEEQYDAAAAEYRALIEQNDDPRLDVNLGAASYRAGAFGDAASAFARALRADDEALREQAFYDLGNAQYRIGERTLEANPQETIAAWEQAIGAYDEALALDATDEDTKFNRELVQRKLDELKQQQEQQPDEQEQDQQKDEQKEEEQQKQQQDQPQRDQAPGDQPPKDEQQEQQPRPPEESKENQEEPPQNQNPEQKNAGTPEDQPPSEPKGSDRENGPPADTAPEPEKRLPGQLSPDEARDLLDSVEGDEEFMPMVPMAPSDSSEDPRDW